jgi:UDP-glucose 4-epimerase
MIVVVTGAAGYIGGEISLLLKDAGHTVVGVDRRPRPGHLGPQQEVFDRFVQADFDSDEVYRVLINLQPDAVVHCAGTSLVGPSMTNPSDYWNNNVTKTQHLLNILTTALPRTRFIFSSSAAVYGEPVMIPCHEVDPKEPFSPYGQSKLAVEWMLESYHRAYNLSYVAFRYFNACGADSQSRHGQEPGATHIIARVLESIRDQTEFTLNGVEYATPDGTCVRDYVHVEDIARAHVAALDSIAIPSGVYNLGSASGHSNRQIISAATDITGQTVNVQLGEPRAGDPAVLTADSSKFDQLVSNWRRYNLRDMIAHAWTWYNK